MNVLLIGYGSIGKRYGAVLRALGADFEVYDNPQHEWFSDKEVSDGFTHAIIATPTHTHMDWLDELHFNKVKVLCEKPASKNKARLEKRTMHKDCFVVNNYQFLPCSNTRKKISYNFYNTGKDGLIWDVCQLVYLAYKNKVELGVKRESFWWDLKWGQHQVPYHEIEKSYYHMVKAFLSGDTSNLWNMQDALKMTEICAELYAKGGENVEHFIYGPKGFVRSASEDRFVAFSAQGTPINWAQATS